MTRMPGFGFIVLWFSLTLLTGCAGDFALQKPPASDARSVDEQLLDSLNKVRHSESVSSESAPKKSSQQPIKTSPQPAGHTLFQRQLALSFQPSDRTLTGQHEKIIQLFFQTLPDNPSLEIIITVAPTVGSESFQALQQAWQRLRSLERVVSEYSDRIKLIYQPELKQGSATLKVIGRRRV